jgi:hypothetical protein
LTISQFVIFLRAMKNNLETVEEVIAALGGPKKLKELTFRESPSAVPTWKYRKRFPTTTFTVMQGALHNLGLSAPNNLWGMP